MAEKNAWQHVLDSEIGAEGSPVRIDMNCAFEGLFLAFTQWINDVFKNPGFLPIKAIVEGGATTGAATVHCTFQGSYAQFSEWMTDTFQHPESFTIKVCVGTKLDPIEASPAQSSAPVEGTHASLLPYVKNKTITPKQAMEILVLLKSSQKIEAIKRLRAAANMGLTDIIT